MTDHSSSAGGVGHGRPSEQPAQFGPVEQAAWQQAQAQQHGQHPQQHGQQAQQHGQAVQAQHPQQTRSPYGYPAAAPSSQPQPQQPSDAARAQVAAAWVRRAPQAAVPPSQAAVPTLPPRADQPAAESKKDKRERAKAERKAAYERKKAERGERGRSAPAPTGGQRTASAGPHNVAASAGPHTVAASTASQQVASAAPARAGFDVPRPGGRLPAQGRRTHVALRATLLITTCAFALGSCGVMGLVVGKSSDVRSAALDAKDVQRFRLTEFPTRTAATFAEEYAALCLTYSPPTADQRRKALTRYASAGVDADCGWDGSGKQSVTLATWDGTAEEIPEYGKNGRYLGVQVRLSTGRTTTLSVPVYVKDLAGASGLRIVGDVGEMPLPVRGTAPEVDKDDEVVDQDLSDQLRTKVLPGYFEAWAESDATAMTRFTTPDATLAATSGLAGALSAPKIHEVAALAPAGTDDGDSVAYDEGESVWARVTVEWGGGTSADETAGREPGPVVRRSYRVTVVNTAQGWFIKDIRGGVLDPTGGRADEGDPVTPGTEGVPPADDAEPSGTGKPADNAPPSGGAKPAGGGKPAGAKRP